MTEVGIEGGITMSRMPYADLAALSPDARKWVGPAPINVIRMMAGASDAVFKGFCNFSAAFFAGTKLDPVLREIAILRAGHIAGSAYETFQHEAMARHLKMTDAQLAAIKQGGRHPGVLTPQQQAVMDFADDIVVNVRASDANLAAVRAFLSDDQVIDLIMVTGLYMTISRFLETTGVDMEDTARAWQSMVQLADDKRA
jgi:alkylhydroperoxidase family enzyme